MVSFRIYQDLCMFLLANCLHRTFHIIQCRNYRSRVKYCKHGFFFNLKSKSYIFDKFTTYAIILYSVLYVFYFVRNWVFYYLLFSDRYARLIRKKDVVDFNNRIAHINQYFKICIRISTTNNCINTDSKDVLRSWVNNCYCMSMLSSMVSLFSR